MLVVGAGGLAAQMFHELETANIKDLTFWSETPTKFAFIEEHFPILSNDDEVSQYFATTSRSFVLAVGGSKARRQMAEKFTALGELTSYISPGAEVSRYVGDIGQGTVILKSATIEPGATIGWNCLINRFANLGHDCKVGDLCEIAPYTLISADSEIGKNTLIGMGAFVLPKVKVGSDVIVQAGAFITKNLPDRAVATGVPAEIRFIQKEKKTGNESA